MILTATEIIKKSWRDYLDNFHDWAIFALFIFLPAFVLMVGGSFGIFLDAYLPSSSVATGLILFTMFIAAMALSFWNSLALIHAVAGYIENKQTDHWKEHYGAALSSFWSALLVSILVGLAVIGGSLLFFIPGIIFSLWFYFSVYNVVIQHETGTEAMSASRNLVKGRWWSTAWRIVAPGLLFGLAVGVINIVISGLVSFLPFSTGTINGNTLIGNVLSTILSAFVAPLTTLATAHLYFTLRENPLVEKPAEMPTP